MLSLINFGQKARPFFYIVLALLSSSVVLSTHADTIWVDGSDVGGIPSSTIAITDLQVDADNPGDTVPVSLYVPSGTLQMSTTTGLTFTGASSGSQLYFSGTETDVNAALATLTYTNGSTGTFTLEASIVSPGQVYNPTTQHIYEVVNNGSTLTGGQARTAALARSINGVSGYLANITSSDENSFVAARISNDGWFGASDAETEGTWKWLDGPEAGTVFWIGTGSGTAYGYENWAGGEPNQSGDEDCSQFYANGSGWNDLSCSGSISTYIVEYGAPSDVVTIATSTLDITVAADVTPPDAPTLVVPESFNNQYPTISGTCEVAATVTITITPTAEVIHTTCDGDGNYSVTPSTLIPYGEYSVTAYQTDPSSNVGPSTNGASTVSEYGVGGGGSGGSGAIVEDTTTVQETSIIEESEEAETDNSVSTDENDETQETNLEETTQEGDEILAGEDTTEGSDQSETGDDTLQDEYHYRMCEMGVDLLTFGAFESNGICEGFFQEKETGSEHYLLQVMRSDILHVAISMLRDNENINSQAAEHQFDDVEYTGEEAGLSWETKVALEHSLITPNRNVFEPSRFVTRAEAYAMIMPTVCLYPSGSDEESWQQRVHNTAYREGITQFAWDDFQPERYILQQELFVIVSRVADWAEVTGGCHPRSQTQIEE